MAPKVQPSTFSSTTLFARKPGFLDDPNGRSQVEATPGAEVDIPLLPEALIKGRVIFAEADPAPGATVQLYSRQVQDGMPRWLPAGSARANSNGEFRFAELRPGSYRVGTDELPDNDPADQGCSARSLDFLPSTIRAFPISQRRERFNLPREKPSKQMFH